MMARDASVKPPQEDAPKTTQARPTKPRPMDKAGNVLDEHGLPLGGPARIDALAGNPDPMAATAPATEPDTSHPAQEQ